MRARFFNVTKVRQFSARQMNCAWRKKKKKKFSSNNRNFSFPLIYDLTSPIFTVATPYLYASNLFIFPLFLSPFFFILRSKKKKGRIHTKRSLEKNFYQSFQKYEHLEIEYVIDLSRIIRYKFHTNQDALDACIYIAFFFWTRQRHDNLRSREFPWIDRLDRRINDNVKDISFDITDFRPTIIDVITKRTRYIFIQERTSLS